MCLSWPVLLRNIIVADKIASMRLPFFIMCRFCCPFAVLPFCVTSTFSVEFPFRFMFCLVCCPCVPVLRPGRKRTRCAMFRRRAAPPRYEVVDLRPPPGRGRVCPLPGLIELINTASTDWWLWAIVQVHMSDTERLNERTERTIKPSEQ